MGNGGKNSNTSQFFFTLQEKLPQLDKKHVVMGKIVEGYDVLDLLSNLEQKKGTEEPSVEVLITDCGKFIPGSTLEQGFLGCRRSVQTFPSKTRGLELRLELGL
jgi:hypothetical protein